LERRMRKVVGGSPRRPQQPWRGKSHDENTSDERLETSHEDIPSATPTKGCFGGAVYAVFFRAFNEICHRVLESFEKILDKKLSIRSEQSGFAKMHFTLFNVALIFFH